VSKGVLRIAGPFSPGASIGEIDKLSERITGNRDNTLPGWDNVRIAHHSPGTRNADPRRAWKHDAGVGFT
jgi:hypothetical protein